MKTTDRGPKAERVAKAERQDAILRAIEENHIDTQEQLAEALRQAAAAATGRKEPHPVGHGADARGGAGEPPAARGDGCDAPAAQGR